MAVSDAELRTLVFAYPEVTERPSHGHASFFIEKKMFTGLRGDNRSILYYVDSIDERDFLLEVRPDTFHITNFERDHPRAQARLDKLDAKELSVMLERRFRAVAPKRLVKSYDESRAGRSTRGK